jgi:subtilisin family serine protease
MKRLFAYALLITASSAFGQPAWSPPALDTFIVEFRDAPAALAKKSINYRAALTRFRADLTAISRQAEVRHEYFRVLNGAAVRASRAELAAIARLPYVKAVHPDVEVHTMAGPAVTQVNADAFWSAYSTRGKGVVVAIIDTGVDYTHDALGNGFGPGHKVAGGYDFVNDDNDPFDDNGHGTHVAGIIAGDSTVITGIAPDATLMAFKVLRASGSGTESDVIAAIERATDPNGDGDTSDHVDVANLSLGGAGGPDDPGSRAIDNATRLGVVFCIAAGNSGRYHGVSSPGTARSAITVGAVDDGDSMASFSSRGPTPKDMTMKPEVSAPGVSITSSFPGNRYVALSGTSMATPHVAGAAALLKALHHDWTPAQIKAALMTGSAWRDQEIMAIGAGRIDVSSAAALPLITDTPSIDFALDPVEQAKWSPSRTIRVTNNGQQTATWTASTTAPAGVAATLAPQTLTLDPGQSGTVTLSLDVDNAVVVAGSSFSIAGSIALNSAGNRVHVPWTFVKAVRAITTWDKEFAAVQWYDSAHTALIDATPIDANASEMLVSKAGDYDVAVFGSTLDDKSGALVRASLIWLERQHLDRDTTIATTEAQASHVIRGANVQISPDQTYAMMGRLVWPAGTPLTTLTIPALPLRELHVNDIAERNALFFDEAYVDFLNNEVQNLQHPPLAGVHADVTLLAQVVKSVPVQLLIPPPAAGDARITAGVVPNRGASGLAIQRAVSGTVWNGRLYLTPDADPTATPGIFFTVITDGQARYTTPLLHMIDGEVTGNVTANPRRYDGGTFIFGGGPRLAVATFTAGGNFIRPNLFVDLFGPRGETRTTDRPNTQVVLTTAAGTVKSRTFFYPASLDLSVKGPYTIEATNDGTQYPDLPLETKLTMKIDSSRADYTPPTLTAIYLVDGAGTAVRAATPHAAASLYFSAADFAYNPAKTYQQVRGEATTLSYRYAGAAAWTALPIVQVNEDSAGGLLYRADLSSVTNTDSARVDLKIDLQDNAGNTTSVVMQPAFTVGPEHPPRRRAAR